MTTSSSKPVRPRWGRVAAVAVLGLVLVIIGVSLLGHTPDVNGVSCANDAVRDLSRTFDQKCRDTQTGIGLFGGVPLVIGLVLLAIVAVGTVRTRRGR